MPSASEPSGRIGLDFRTGLDGPRLRAAGMASEAWFESYSERSIAGNEHDRTRVRTWDVA